MMKLKPITCTISKHKFFNNSYAFIIPLLLAVTLSCLGPNLYPEESDNKSMALQIKAAYIYNFTKFMEWSKSDPEFFYITVLGRSGIADPLNKIAGKQKVNGKRIVVNTIEDPDDLNTCNILYLPVEDKVLFPDILKKIRNKNILLVTDSDGFAEKGAAINFIKVGSRIKFEVNRKAIKNAGIVPSSHFISLAARIYQ